MSLIFLCLVIPVLWINLLGAGLCAGRIVGDYALARVTGVIGICLACFCLEHSVGWGPRLPILPVTTVVSIWMIWRNRDLLRRNWKLEALFGAGFFYCFAWRYTFPDIDYTEDKMPNFALIEAYMRGTRLPPPDLWLAPFYSNTYYSFQHYGAALLGRLLGVGPGVSYHLAFCTLVGFLTLLSGSCFARLCPWPLGRWVGVLSLVIGGSGAAVAAHALVKDPHPIDIVRFVGGAIARDELTPLGHRASSLMSKPGLEPRDLPMEPLSYFLTKGDFHPPLAGFVLLALAAALIAAQETGATGRARTVNHALIAATIPIALISNAWILPLQCLLAGGWFVYRAIRREWGCLLPGLAGAAVAAGLEYPYLVQFTQQAIGSSVAFRLVLPNDHTPWLGWLLMFWPAAGIMALATLNRERRPLSLFLIVVWGLALAGTELFFIHDLYEDAWARFNSALKWWPWAYAGIILTLGATNLGSGSRLCRYGTLLLLLPNLSFAYDLGRQFAEGSKESLGTLSGSAWIDRDVVIRDLIVELASRPDGVTLESGLDLANTEAPAVSLFANKQSLLGWPWLEEAYRGSYLEIPERFDQIKKFYSAKAPDPLGWLLHNNVKYILWLPKDNSDKNARFQPINDRIRSRYYWHGTYGNDKDFAVGFWERNDIPAAR
ncbi:MAG: DUF2298 domain-containing protein [Opitutaceae bacterium]|jgi:hypothetical protein